MVDKTSEKSNFFPGNEFDRNLKLGYTDENKQKQRKEQVTIFLIDRKLPVDERNLSKTREYIFELCTENLLSRMRRSSAC